VLLLNSLAPRRGFDPLAS